MAAPASLAALEGSWSMTREVRHADGQVNRMRGVATFRRSGPRLVMDEDGYLEGQGHAPLRATRRYVWTQARDRFDVHFGDMRPFHTVPIGLDRPETVYLCPPDRYEVAYDFSQFPQWSATWRVTGPKKDYEMKTLFARAG